MEFYNFIRFNSIYFAFSLVVMGVPIDVSVGWRQFLLVITYHVFFLYYAYRNHLEKWLNIFSYLLPLSIFLFLPDWIFSSIIKVLVYIDKDIYQIANIPIYIAGMWTIPLFLIIAAGEICYKKYRKIWLRDFLLMFMSFLIFDFFEEITWELPVWYYKNVHMTSHIATYLIIPNTLVGLYAYYGYKLVARRPLPVRIIGAFLVMLLQLGTTMLSYFFWEKL